MYEPREDSELMAKEIEKLNLKGKKALEIGCGSGLLSIIMAKKDAIVTSVDIDEKAAGASRKNAENNGVSLDCTVSDLFENVTGKFDLIVFNPPYLPTDDDESDNTYSGGLSGRETIERFMKDVKRHLNPGGYVLLLISSLTGEKEVMNLMKSKGMTAEIIAREKVPLEELVVIEAQHS